MRVVYLTSPSFLDYALSLVDRLAARVELHLVVEISPEDWGSSMFELEPGLLAPGIHDACVALTPYFPEPVKQIIGRCASATLAVNDSRRSMSLGSLVFSYRLHDLIGSLKPQVLHVDPPSLRCAYFFYRQRGVPVLANIHDPSHHSGESDWRKSLARSLYFWTVDRHLLFSRALAPDFIRRYKLQEDSVEFSRLCPFEVYRAYLNEIGVEHERHFLFFGRLSPYKGIDVLLESMRLLSAGRPDIQLVIAGKSVSGYAVEDKLRLATQTLNIRYIGGRINNETLAELFASSIAVICPYLDATQSGVVSTAYAFGKPVLASNTGGLPEYVADGISGKIVSVGDAAELASKMEELYCDGLLLARLKSGVKEFTDSELDWDDVVSNLVRTYCKMSRQYTS